VADVTLTAERLVAGGDALAHLPDGRVVFVDGALPGERVVVRPAAPPTGRHPLHGRVQAVLDASSERRTPPCRYAVEPDGCGGCGWQHAEPELQRRAKVDLVADALRHLGRLADPDVRAGTQLPTERVRTSLRLGVVDGRAGLRRRRSHDVLAIDDCLVTHTRLTELLADGRFGDAEEVVLRVGARTGDRLALVSPTAAGVTLPPDVRVVGADELAAGKRVWIHELVGGHRLRISAQSFWQPSPEGAEALGEAVVRAAEGRLGAGHRVVDAYAGVGLLTVLAAAAATGPLTLFAVEQSASACADARVNLAPLGARVVRTAVERWRPSPADLVIADPPRTGLGRGAVRHLAESGADRLVLVSCDAAALARDAGLLATHGFRFDHATVLDLFPQTPHVEVVSRFDRA
jgi:23S rRNA (uracil1939-C5)-methyltransferase